MTKVTEQKQAAAVGIPEAAERRAPWRRLWMLVLLLVVVYAAGNHFIGIAQSPLYQVHSDDVIWMMRFQRLPYAAPPGDPEYIHGIDQGSLERYVYHYLLSWTGKLPREEMPTWDYSQSADWNIAQGHVAPADPVRLVRVMNAAMMVAAAALILVALARAASPLAGLVGALFFTAHPAGVEIIWSIGSDPLLWMLMTAALALWVYLEMSLRSVVIIGIVAGLATSAKINGAAVPAAYCAWLILKRRPRLALVAGGAALAVFIMTNPILFGSGIAGVPSTIAAMVEHRATQAAGMARAMAGQDPRLQAYLEAPRWMVFVMLLGQWWPLLPLLLVSRRTWRLEPATWWGLGLVAVNGLAVTIPLPRYVMPIQAGLVLGVIAAYWPQGAAHVFGRLARAKRALAARRPR